MTLSGANAVRHPLSNEGRLPNATLVAIVATELVALGSLTVPLMLGLAMAVNRIDTRLDPEGALAVVTASGAVAALVANPVFGYWCDRVRNRSGGRAAFLLGGVLAGCAAVALLLAADTLLMLTAAWMLAQASFNATFAALYGLIADLVPEPDRARVSGWFGGAAVGSVVVGMGLVAVLPKELPVVLLIMPTLAVPVTLAAYWHLRKAAAGVGVSPPTTMERMGRAELLRTLRATPQYWLVWLQRLLVQSGYGMVTIFGLFYLMRRADLAEEEAATWVAASSAVAAVVSIGCSIWAGSRAGRRGAYRGYLLLSVGLIAVALVIKAAGVDPLAYLVAAVLVGAGIGCYYAIDLALVLRTVPRQSAGLLLGFFNIARTLPQSLVPAAAPLLIAIGDGDPIGDSEQNYTALYVVGFLVVLASLIPLRWMTVLRRPSDARPEPGPAGSEVSA